MASKHEVKRLEPVSVLGAVHEPFWGAIYRQNWQKCETSGRCRPHHLHQPRKHTEKKNKCWLKSFISEFIQISIYIHGLKTKLFFSLWQASITPRNKKAKVKLTCFFSFINTGSNNNSIKSISTTICVCYMLLYLDISAGFCCENVPVGSRSASSGSACSS